MLMPLVIDWKCDCISCTCMYNGHNLLVSWDGAFVIAPLFTVADGGGDRKLV